MSGRLVLWRHGQTDWNLTGRFQGQADVPLNDTGLAQAAAAAPVVAGYGPARIVASDLTRARQTAQAVADLTGTEVEVDARFREIHVGEWEGLGLDEVRRLRPDFLHEEIAGVDVRRGDTGESTGEVAERVGAVLHEVAAQGRDDDVVLVVMHGLAIRLGAAHFLGFSLREARLLGGLDNCGWVVLDRSRMGTWQLGAYNVVADPHAVTGQQTRELAATAAEDPSAAHD